MVVTDPPTPPACTGETEGELREKLAAYFLSAPPLDRQDDEQKRRHKAALRRLLRLENRSILQAAGLPRPLSQGDLAVLLRALLDACLQTLGAARQRDSAVPLMSVQIAEGFPLREAAGFEPRLVQAGVVGLLRAACRANPADLVAVSLSAGTEAFILTVTGERRPPRRGAGRGRRNGQAAQGRPGRLFRHRWAVAVHQPAGGRGAVCRPHPDPAAAGHPVGRAGGSLFVAGIKVLEDVVHRGLAPDPQPEPGPPPTPDGSSRRPGQRRTAGRKPPLPRRSRRPAGWL